MIKSYFFIIYLYWMDFSYFLVFIYLFHIFHFIILFFVVEPSLFTKILFSLLQTHVHFVCYCYWIFTPRLEFFLSLLSNSIKTFIQNLNIIEQKPCTNFYLSPSNTMKKYDSKESFNLLVLIWLNFIIFIYSII